LLPSVHFSLQPLNLPQDILKLLPQSHLQLLQLRTLPLPLEA
jgi:hypothetical protein